MLPRADLREGNVEKLVSGGDGLIRTDGPLVFVPGVLPGEVVRYEVTSHEKGFDRGRLVAVLEASPDRREAPCRLYAVCGGCDFMHLTEVAQRRQKQILVVESFRRIAKIVLETPPVVAGPDWAYRIRLQLHKVAAGDRAGFMGRSSRELVAVESCPVAAPGFAELLASGAPELPAGRTTVFAPAETAWQEGRDKVVRVDVAGKPFLVATEGFFQSNLALLPVFVKKVLDGLPQHGRRALDLYCGVGLFGAFLADRFEIVTAVEENVAALALARKNIVGPLHEFVALSLETWVARLKKKPSQPWEAIVVDPPRTGLSREVRSFLTEFPTPALVYVSCNPDTLARDTVELVAGGYRLVSLTLFDFYPQTSHIEAVAHFAR